MSNPRLIWIILLVVVAVGGLTVFSLLRDPDPTDTTDVVLELIEKSILVAAMAAIAWTVQGIAALRDGQQALTNNLARATAQGDAWRDQSRREIAALGQAIEDQFHKWHLTVAEIDIAGLMLKGASLKEIALARDTSEATIRQQAQSVYRKSGLSGRAELSAYFLESLFGTAEDAAAKRPALTVV